MVLGLSPSVLSPKLQASTETHIDYDGAPRFESLFLSLKFRGQH